MSDRAEGGTRRMPWSQVPPTLAAFRNPPREYGILPFWFLNGALDPDEMRWQLRELRDKGMPGIILHGRFGLERLHRDFDYLDEDMLELRVANTLINLLEGVGRPSGLAGPPPYRRVTFAIPE